MARHVELMRQRYVDLRQMRRSAEPLEALVKP